METFENTVTIHRRVGEMSGAGLVVRDGEPGRKRCG